VTPQLPSRLWAVTSGIAAAMIVVGALLLAARSHRTLRILVPDNPSSMQIRAIAEKYQKEHEINIRVTAFDYQALLEALDKMTNSQRPEYDVLLIHDTWLALAGRQERALRSEYPGIRKRIQKTIRRRIQKEGLCGTRSKPRESMSI
jgi:hypothetical protein